MITVSIWIVILAIGVLLISLFSLYCALHYIFIINNIDDDYEDDDEKEFLEQEVFHSQV